MNLRTFVVAFLLSCVLPVAAIVTGTDRQTHNRVIEFKQSHHCVRNARPRSDSYVCDIGFVLDSEIEQLSEDYD